MSDDYCQIFDPDFQIHIGIKDDSITCVDWSESIKIKNLTKEGVLAILESAIIFLQ